MRYLLIILVCSVQLSWLGAQDLEDNYASPARSVSHTSDLEDGDEEDWFAGEDDSPETFLDQQTEVQASDAGRDPSTYRKEEYLNSLLRHMYYQKITTSPWSKYLHHESWTDNVQRWRYLSQLRNFITSNDKNILVLRDLPDDPVDEPVREVPIVAEDSMIRTTAASTKELDTKDTMVQRVIAAVEPSTLHIDLTADSLPCTPAELELIALAVVAETDLKTNEGEGSVVKETETKETLEEDIQVVDDTPTKEANDHTESPEPAVVSTPLPTAIPVRDDRTVSTSPATQIATSTDPSKTPRVSDEETLKPLTPRRSTTTLTLSPYTFSERKGSFSWPIRGRVTDSFGMRKNAEARGLRPENYGVDMLCPPGAKVKAIHQGTVLMSKRQSPYDIIVTIKHDNYTTAYYYLIKSYVKPGDQVLPGQPIGHVRTSVQEADFHFEIWHDQNRVNPELWLQKR